MTSPVARNPSPAEVRTGLAPAAVDALADSLHELLCVRLFDWLPPAMTSEHRGGDRAKARFLLLSLRQSGWSVELGTKAA